ncbi:MAG: HEPN domain-containing protein [Candidatus Methanoperedens sp.]|nr:HEPN domain-containing protein [Candidatus Methanoperedens sp.]MCZ7361713.1 HEPN domain-containing protein [Candidatus Methanoperedens sp.]HLB71865.1 HEPN domain-containing protein [Candidatus Methanoperedens sp.]
MNEEIDALLKKALDSIKGARLLFDDELYGFAVSRAYYAIFYLVSAVLVTKSLSFSKHQAVVAAFGQHFVKTGIFEQKFHRYFVEAFEQRQIGDYEPMEEITQETAKKNIERAIEFLNVVKEYLENKK